MKFSIAAIALFTLSAVALPATVIRRGASAATVNLISEVEDFRADFYDMMGHKTIGYGHDCVAKKDCDSINAPISNAQGDEILHKDLVGFEQCVCALPNANALNANQYGALVSYAFNTGCGGLQQAWTAAMTSKNFDSICADLPHTNTLNGVLDNRRKKEAALCSTPTTQMSGC
ncbi:lysozyme-like domain-containing protein [Aspergillus transmontanensis]|uniref:Lysozyme-like domain-containing protein n=1 Tax=Aspergillus transmontanensis TaxID=1034304 RepID=A0A5N6W040_9EURO|nr:lysozyme-like domain-containing protein [Aspergillus transmontanensis]